MTTTADHWCRVCTTSSRITPRASESRWTAFVSGVRRTVGGLVAGLAWKIAGHGPMTDGLLIRCRAGERVVEAERQAARALAVRHQLGAWVNDMDELAKALGDQSSQTSWAAGTAVLVLLEALDDGPEDREWRQGVWGEAQ